MITYSERDLLESLGRMAGWQQALFAANCAERQFQSRPPSLSGLRRGTFLRSERHSILCGCAARLPPDCRADDQRQVPTQSLAARCSTRGNSDCT